MVKNYQHRSILDEKNTIFIVVLILKIWNDIFQ